MQLVGSSKLCAAYLQMALQNDLYKFAICALTHYRDYISEGNEETITKFVDMVSFEFQYFNTQAYKTRKTGGE